jgi:hypothetical protein
MKHLVILFSHKWVGLKPQIMLDFTKLIESLKSKSNTKEYIVLYFNANEEELIKQLKLMI